MTLATDPSDDALRTLTGEEQALYDRQIRLWGEDAQRRLSASCVLLVCDPSLPLAQEVAKNVLLAGIAKLAIQPLTSKPRTELDRQKKGRGFLGDSTENVIRELQEMNPLVNVSLLQSETEPTLSEFRVACIISAPLRVELTLSDACRKAGIAFLCGRTCGETGWIFVDAGDDYSYTVGEGAASHTENSHYVSYRSAIDARWGGEVRRAQFGWHVARTLLEFEHLNDRLPQDEADFAKIEELYQYLCKNRTPAHVRPDIILRAARSAQFVLPPIAGIVGGLWGRETIKVISGKGAPLDGNNLFFFNAATNVGAVERVAPRDH